MENRAVRLEKIALTRCAVKLPPGATARMAIGTEIAQSQPALIVTARMRAEMPGGVDDTRAAGRRRHGSGSSWRLRLGVVKLVFAHGAMRSLAETHKGFGLVGPLALQPREHWLH